MSLELFRKDFNVGQGGFTAIKVKDCGVKIFSLVFDCGSSTSRDKFCEEEVFNEFKEFNENGEINLVVFSHLDADHINMGGNLLMGYLVEKIALPYLSNELVLCFMRSFLGNRSRAGTEEFCRDFYLEKERSIAKTRTFYNISSSSLEGRHSGESAESEVVMVGEGQIQIGYRYRENKIQGESFGTKTLEEIVFKKSGPGFEG